MARAKKSRLIHNAPRFSGFKPTGVSCKKSNFIVITYEEYEAVNLCDYELLTQEESAKLMKVSRPTFTRIYESARRKIAKAFIEGFFIKFEGGNTTAEVWYSCPKCNISFSVTEISGKFCPFCTSNEIIVN